MCERIDRSIRFQTTQTFSSNQSWEGPYNRYDKHNYNKVIGACSVQVMAKSSSFIDSITLSEYTGRNRCMPCTILNLAITTVVTAALFTQSIPLAVSVFAASCIVIYFRGYLVPGTPTLTRRYLPDRVLRRFGKSMTDAEVVTRERREVDDVAKFLLDAGVVTDCNDKADICIDSSFREAWNDRIEWLRDENPRTVLAEVFSVNPKNLSIGRAGGRMTVHHGDDLFTLWPSKAAYLADVAAQHEFSDRLDSWTRIDDEQRGRILQRLRVLLMDCPSCGGVVDGGTTKQACCIEESMFEVSCGDCGAVLLQASVTESDPT